MVILQGNFGGNGVSGLGYSKTARGSAKPEGDMERAGFLYLQEAVNAFMKKYLPERVLVTVDGTLGVETLNARNAVYAHIGRKLGTATSMRSSIDDLAVNALADAAFIDESMAKIPAVKPPIRPSEPTIVQAPPTPPSREQFEELLRKRSREVGPTDRGGGMIPPKDFQPPPTKTAGLPGNLVWWIVGGVAAVGVVAVTVTSFRRRRRVESV